MIRGGDIVGNHSVIFAGPGEQIIIKHNATDRMIFARGALKAAKWGMTAEKGEYSMQDVLNLKLNNRFHVTILFYFKKYFFYFCIYFYSK